jgi:hypothetical protein
MSVFDKVAGEKMTAEEFWEELAQKIKDPSEKYTEGKKTITESMWPANNRYWKERIAASAAASDASFNQKKKLERIPNGTFII